MRSYTYLSVLMLLLPVGVLAHVDPRLDCLSNLRLLEGAKTMLELEHKLKAGDPVEPDMLKPYLPGQAIRRCLAGGRYTIGPIGVDPVCSIPSHSEAALERDMERQARRDRMLLCSVIGTGSVGTAWVALAVFAARRRARGAANKGGPANRSQPVRPETNEPSAAAGSGR